MFLLRCFHRIALLLFFVCLFNHAGGRNSFAFYGVCGQKEDSHYNSSCPNKGAMVSESKSWVPIFIKATASYHVLKSLRFE